MTADHLLRLYVNPVKQFLYLLGSGVLLLGGLLLLHDPKVRANPTKAAMAYVAVVFFGLCATVFLFMVLRYVVFRRPVLQIDAQGWSYSPPLLGEAQAVPWYNIRAIALFRQKLPRNTMYYLVVYAKDPQQLPHTRTRTFTARFYPSLSGAAMSIPLNSLFVRTTPAKGKRLLERIASTCPHEMQLHRVQVSGELYDI